MFRQTLMLVMVFIMAFETNTSSAKDKSYRCPCDCIDLIAEAVNAIMLISYCDLSGVWEAPHDLEGQLENLQNWCSKKNKPLKSNASELVEEMLETIHITIVGKSHTLNGKTVVVSEPAPDCAIEELLNLQNLLLYGSPKQVIE